MKKIDISKLKSFYKKNKILSIAIVIAIVLVISWGRSRVITASKEGGFSFFGKAKPKVEEMEPVIPVNVMKTKLIDFKDILSAIGTIKGAVEIDLKFQENGYIDSFNFKEGDAVKKDDVLASLDQKEKKIKVDYSAIEFEKNKKLYELGGISKPKFEQASLELDSAKNELNKTSIFAPSDGFMGTRLFDKGSFVTTSDKVGSFVDPSSLKCEVGIIEKDADKVKNGQKAFVLIDAYPDKTFDALVDSVSPMLEGRSKTQTVKMRLENPNNIIKPGMFARANIVIFEKPNSVVIPTSALKKTEEGFVVFTVEREKLEDKKDEDSKTKKSKSKEEAKKELKEVSVELNLATEEVSRFGFAKEKKVKVGRISQDLVLIEEGLAENEEVIIETPESKEKIKNDSKVEILSGE